MPLAQFAGADHILDFFRQPQKPQGISHRRPALAHSDGQLVLCQAGLIHQFLEGLGGFNRIEVFPLQIFHQGHLQHLGFVFLLQDYCRDILQPGQVRGPVAPFAGNEDIAVIFSLDQHRLEHSLAFERLGQFPEAGVVELLPWLHRVGGDFPQR